MKQPRWQERKVERKADRNARRDVAAVRQVVNLQDDTTDQAADALMLWRIKRGILIAVGLRQEGL